jgi:hypothetical protein
MRISLPLAALLLLSSSGFGGSAQATCRPSIALDASGPRPTVAITVANGAGGTAIFDTGAIGAIVDPQFAGTFGLANEGPLRPPFDRMPGSGHYRSTLRGLRLGGILVGDVEVPVVPTPLPGIAAILSPRIFAGRLVELDLGAGRMRLCDKAGLAALGPGTPYTEGPFALPAITVTVGDATVTAHIDSGSPIGLSFPMRFATQFPLTAPMVQRGSARGHNGVSPVYIAHISGTVRVGALTLTDPEVSFSDVMTMPNVGAPLLRQLIVTLDPDGQRSWARAAPATRR